MKKTFTCGLVIGVLSLGGCTNHYAGSDGNWDPGSSSFCDTSSSSSSRSDSGRGSGGGGNSPSRDGGGVASGAVPWSSPKSGK